MTADVPVDSALRVRCVQLDVIQYHVARGIIRAVAPPQALLEAVVAARIVVAGDVHHRKLELRRHEG